MQAGLQLPDGLGRLVRPGRSVLEAGLLVAIAILCGRMVWLGVAPSDSVAGQSERPLPSPVIDARSALDADRTRLVETNPFGTQSVTATEVVVEAPETTLNLRLIGLFMSTGSELSSVQIVTPDNRAQRFRAGDEILPGVTIERILSDRVILRRNGANEALLRDGRSETLAVISDGSQIVTSLPSGDAQNARESGGTEEIAGVIENPENFLGAVSLIPIERGGSVFAYEIRSASAASLTSTGLQAGDMLRAINGRPVAQLTQGDFIDAVQEDEQIILLIERNGAERRVRLEIDG